MTSRMTFALCLLAASVGSASAESPGLLEFDGGNTLFLADSIGGVIQAYTLPEGTPGEGGTFNLLDVDRLVAGVIGAEGRLRYGDLAVHPVTGEAFVSVSVDGAPTVVAISQTGEARRIDLAALPSTSYKLSETADSTVTFWRDIPAPSLTITDLDYVAGELFVSGVSTGEFASTLRRVPYPFDGSSAATSVEMFHAAHGQNETRAPVRAMTVVDLDGVPTVVAAYTCTPLVTIPVEALTDGAHVTGKTIAELGYGNTPLDVLAFEAANMQGEIQSYVLMVNREMDADLIPMEALTAAAAAPGLAQPVPYLGATAGVETVPLPMSGVVHVADQDGQFLVALRRDLDTGAMDLLSFRKGAFFRLSDFISEYNFPDYAYADDQTSQGIRMFQNMLKADEGYPGQIRQ